MTSKAERLGYMVELKRFLDLGFDGRLLFRIIQSGKRFGIRGISAGFSEASNTCPMKERTRVCPNEGRKQKYGIKNEVEDRATEPRDRA